MVQKKNMMNYIEYEYKPFSKTQCLVRLILIWILGVLMCMIGKDRLLWLVISLMINISISTIFGILIVKYSKAKISRFLCDGLTCLSVSIILAFIAYRVFVLQSEYNWIVAVIFLGILFMCIFVFTLIVHIKVKAGMFNEPSKNKRNVVWPYIGASIGVFFARVFLQDMSMEGAVLAICILLLSLMVGLGSANLLRAIYLKQISESPEIGSV